jgi:hypothetical protein
VSYTFECIVVGDDPVEEIKRFEQTTDARYATYCDRTLDMMKKYKAGSCIRIKTPSGDLMEYYDDFFFRRTTKAELRSLDIPEELLEKAVSGGGVANRTAFRIHEWDEGKDPYLRIHDIPHGFEEVTLDTGDVLSFKEFLMDEDLPLLERGETGNQFREGCEEGWVELDGEGEVTAVVMRVNVNKKMDFCRVGGRFRNQLIVKDGCEFKDVSDTAGLMNVLKDLGIPLPESLDKSLRKTERGNSAAIGDLDLDAMRERVSKHSQDLFDLWESLFLLCGKARSLTEVQLDEDTNKDTAKAVYESQPLVCAFQAHDDLKAMGTDLVESIGYDREKFVEKALNRIMIPWAIVVDGKWYSRGELSEHGFRKELDEETWAVQVRQHLDKVPRSETITIMECHVDG